MGLFDIFSTNDAKAAAAAQAQGISSGYNAAQPLLQQGYGTLATNYAAGLSPLLQNYSASASGANAYGDATGANGAQGYANALQNFQTNPGYQFQLQQGTQNVLRNQAATGQLASGATNVDLQNYGQGVANQGYQSYVQNLLPFLPQSTTTGGQIAATDASLGQQENTNLGTQANLAYGAQTGIGNANANADLSGLTASANTIGALMNLFKGGATTAGAGGGSSVASGIGSLASGVGSGASSLASGLGAFLASDEDLKTDIEPIGELYDGQPIYRYKYIDDPVRTHIGLIAQEVEQLEPDAVREFGGFKAVDYGKATELAAGLADFLEAA